jgi:hypothetical protein
MALQLINYCLDTKILFLCPLNPSRKMRKLYMHSKTIIAILSLLALLMPLAFSASDIAVNIHSSGEAAIAAHDVGHSAIAHASEGMFVGSTKSNKYHYPSCRWAEKILPENEIWFSSSADAGDHGYVACGVCHPP